MKLWKINGEEYTDIGEATEALINGMDDKPFDDYLDEINDIIKICGLEYYPSRVLKESDPTAYVCEQSDFENSIREEVEQSLKAMNVGESEEIYGVYVQCQEVKSKKTA